MRKRIKMIHTGGTFSMVLDKNQQATVEPTSVLHTLTNAIPELAELADMEIEILCNLDSSDMTPAHWSQLAQTIVQHWPDCDGYVIIHGTDTLAYSSAALGLCLANVTKPIVFTGSQRPLSALRNDARANLIDAVQLATSGYPGVLLCFDSTAHWGTRATKFTSEGLSAFRSVNTIPIGEFGVHFRLKKFQAATDSSPAPWIRGRFDPNVLCLDCLPGTHVSGAISTAILAGIRALIIRGFGVGTTPAQTNRSWINLAQSAQRLKVPVLMCSQCDEGAVNLTAYENSRVMQKYGVISSLDMGFECSVAKIMLALGSDVPYENMEQYINTPLAEEITCP
jgi:L-asparaginase